MKDEARGRQMEQQREKNLPEPEGDETLFTYPANAGEALDRIVEGHDMRYILDDVIAHLTDEQLLDLLDSAHLRMKTLKDTSDAVARELRAWGNYLTENQE